jgi:hypothetical protein
MMTARSSLSLPKAMMTTRSSLEQEVSLEHRAKLCALATML